MTTASPTQPRGGLCKRCHPMLIRGVPAKATGPIALLERLTLFLGQASV